MTPIFSVIEKSITQFYSGNSSPTGMTGMSVLNPHLWCQAKRLAEMQNNEEARVEGEVKRKEAHADLGWVDF